MHSFYLDAIRNFEGFTPQAKWDYAQLSNGYGTKARYAGEVIDRAEADRRFRAEVSSARAIVEKAAPHVDDGTKAALTSLTYNAGTSWIESGLGEAVRRGDLSAAREIFQKYTKAGGEVLPGLVNRRAQEALWIGNEAPGAAAASVPSVTASADSVLQPAVMARAQAVADVTDLLAKPVRAPSLPSAPSLASASTAPSEPSSRTAEAVERIMASGALGSLTSDALVALIEVDRLGAGGVSDFVRLAQLGRGSELARADNGRQSARTQQS